MEDHVSCEEVYPQLSHCDSVIATDNQCCIEQAKDTATDEHKQLNSADSNDKQDLECVVSVHNDNEEAVEVSGKNDESLPDGSHETELPTEHNVKEPHRESPVLNDRNLEQFSEVLLDSDSSASIMKYLLIKLMTSSVKKECVLLMNWEELTLMKV